MKSRLFIFEVDGEKMSKVIYFVIPCYNEGEVLEVTAKKLTEKVKSLIEKG